MDWLHSLFYLFLFYVDWLSFTSLLTTTTTKSLQSYLILCDPIDGSPEGSPVPGILQARTLEWEAISFTNAWKWKVKVKSCPTLSDPMDYSLPGSSMHGIFQARVLEWGAIAFSDIFTSLFVIGELLLYSVVLVSVIQWSQPAVCIYPHIMSEWKSLSYVLLFVTHWLYSPWNSPGHSTGVGSHSLLQGIFLTQG